MDLERLKQIDDAKTKVLKYVIYKKRTENEIRAKFNSVIDNDILEEVIQELKELGYIDDFNYIERAVNEFMALKNMSIKEMKYKLYSKGLKENVIEEYFSKNNELLCEFEKKSAQNIFIKKSKTMEKQDIILYLRKKGYMGDSIKNAESIYNGNN